MKHRADLDAEIRRENHATSEIQRGIYRWSKTKDRERRDEQIIELWELGVPREEIAERVDLSPARVSQIVRSFGCGWR